MKGVQAKEMVNPLIEIIGAIGADRSEAMYRIPVGDETSSLTIELRSMVLSRPTQSRRVTPRSI